MLKKWQEVIVKNYGIIENKKIAKLISADENVVISEAKRLGVSKWKENNNREWITKGFVTIIRNNWDILTKEEIAYIINLSIVELDEILVEYDFLDIKLGEQPPIQEHRYAPLTKEEIAKTEKIAKYIKPYVKCRKIKAFDFFTNRVTPAPLTMASFQIEERYVSSYCANVKGIFNEGQHYDTTPTPTGFTNFKEYLEGKLLWDVNADVDELTDKYFANYFGAANSAMRAYYDSLCAQWSSVNDGTLTASPFTSAIQSGSLFPKAKVAEWKEYIEQAKAAIAPLATSNPQRYETLLDRIEIESIAVIFLEIVLGYNTDSSYKIQFKSLVTAYGFTECGQGYSLEQLWSEWGL